VLECAQLFECAPGTRAGLYWQADTVNDVESQSLPFLGYHFRILYSQDENAKAGAYDYLINGQLTGETADITASISRFAPGSSWTAVPDDVPALARGLSI